MQKLSLFQPTLLSRCCSVPYKSVRKRTMNANPAPQPAQGQPNKPMKLQWAEPLATRMLIPFLCK
jgi:hypothetical protein